MKNKQRISTFVSIAAILFILIIGSLAFFAISTDKLDSLEKTIEEAGITDMDPVYEAPFSYGDNLFKYITMGVLGIGIILAITFLILRFLVGRDEA